MSAVLHTWGRTLTRHVRLHCPVPGGALDDDELENISELQDDTVQIIQKPFSLGFLLRKVEGHLISNRIYGENIGQPLSITQDTAALR